MGFLSFLNCLESLWAHNQEGHKWLVGPKQSYQLFLSGASSLGLLSDWTSMFHLFLTLFGILVVGNLCSSIMGLNTRNRFWLLRMETPMVAPVISIIDSPMGIFVGISEGRSQNQTLVFRSIAEILGSL